MSASQCRRNQETGASCLSEYSCRSDSSYFWASFCASSAETSGTERRGPSSSGSSPRRSTARARPLVEARGTGGGFNGGGAGLGPEPSAVGTGLGAELSRGIGGGTEGVRLGGAAAMVGAGVATGGTAATLGGGAATSGVTEPPGAAHDGRKAAAGSSPDGRPASGTRESCDSASAWSSHCRTFASVGCSATALRRIGSAERKSRFWTRISETRL